MKQILIIGLGMLSVFALKVHENEGLTNKQPSLVHFQQNKCIITKCKPQSEKCDQDQLCLRAINDCHQCRDKEPQCWEDCIEANNNKPHRQFMKCAQKNKCH